MCRLPTLLAASSIFIYDPEHISFIKPQQLPQNLTVGDYCNQPTQLEVEAAAGRCDARRAMRTHHAFSVAGALPVVDVIMSFLPVSTTSVVLVGCSGILHQTPGSI